MNERKRAPVRVNPLLLHPSEHRFKLDGDWEFRLDPEERGLKERWFSTAPFLDTIQVPGSWQGQGFGGDGKDTVWDFRLQARTFRATYIGTGWYGKCFRLPATWQGCRLWLNLGGVHPSAEVWLNGTRLGENHAPFVPFGFEITRAVRFDADNLLIVRVHEKARPFGMAYNWQGNWSGLYRGVDLTATGFSYLDFLSIHPDVVKEQLRIKAWIGDLDPGEGPLVLRVTVQALGVPAGEGAAATEVPVSAALTELTLPVPSPKLWSPDAPNLYRVDAALLCGDKVLDALSERTGFVHLSTRGKHLLINGEPYYMRGSGDFLSCPETGCPDTNRDRWRRKLTTLREYGYNYVRCQSYVYTPEYFDVADEVGLLVQSEMGMLGAWSGLSIWHVYQWPQPTPDNREALKWQWDRVVMRDVNHPSANIYCMSNEWGMNAPYPRIAWQCYHNTKVIKPTALIIWTDGGHNEELPGDFVNAEAKVDAETAKPLIQHEFRWWSSFPDVRIHGKYMGAVRPYGAELALEAAARRGLAHILPQAATNSQRLQFLEMKTKMEACRRDYPHLAGICHFNAMDTNPSPQGVIDEFYEKKYADAGTWLQTNGDTVVLSSLGFDDRVHCPGEQIAVDLFVSDFSHPSLRQPSLSWRLVDGQEVLASGEIHYEHQPYLTCPAGRIETKVPDVACPRKVQLQATLVEGERLFRNCWDLWFFPTEIALSGVALYGQPQYTWLKGMAGLPSVTAGELARAGEVKTVLSEHLDGELAEYMCRGGRVILAASEGLTRPMSPLFGLPGHYFFTPPANYPTYEDGQNGTIIQQHPALGNFPHEGFADFQFYRLIVSAPPLDLEGLGLNRGDPIIRMIHRYMVMRSLGYLAAYALGQGMLILCALELNQKWPEARYLLGQLCRYAQSGAPIAAPDLTPETLAYLIEVTSIP